jgi:hypothetical protein
MDCASGYSLGLGRNFAVRLVLSRLLAGLLRHPILKQN